MGHQTESITSRAASVKCLIWESSWQFLKRMVRITTFLNVLNPNPNLSLTELNQKMTLLFQIDLEILTIQPKNIPEPDE